MADEQLIGHLCEIASDINEQMTEQGIAFDYDEASCCVVVVPYFDIIFKFLGHIIWSKDTDTLDDGANLENHIKSEVNNRIALISKLSIQ